MSRIKATVLVMCAVFVASAFAASAASATFTLVKEGKKEECVSGLPAICYEETAKLFEYFGEEEVTGTIVAGTESLLSAKFGALEIHITCTAISLPGGTFVQKEPLKVAASVKGKVQFTGCALLAPTNVKCKVPATLETKEILGTVLDEDPTSLIEFVPTTQPFIIIKIENNGTEVCPATIRGEKEATGDVECEVATPSEAATSHNVHCLVTEAEELLLFGEQPAHFELLFTVKLKNLATDKWDLVLA